MQSAEYIRTYWAETVETVGARRVVLIHWDDFFRPLHLPTVWRREDLWS